MELVGGAQVALRAQRAHQQVGAAVAVDVAGASERVAGAVAGGGAVDPVAAAERGGVVAWRSTT